MKLKASFLLLILSISASIWCQTSLVKEPTEKELKLDSKLTAAAKRGNLKEVKRLFEVEKAVIDTKRSLGSKALDVAVLSGRLEVARYLLENGANPNDEVDLKSGDALYRLIASEEDDADMAKLLVEFGVVTSGSARKWSALHYATFMGLEEIVKVLMKVPGTELENKSSSALEIAVKEGHVELVKLLLERGANALWKDQYGYSVIDSGRSSRTTADKREEIIRLLLRSGAK